jgi:hypothetical protein
LLFLRAKLPALWPSWPIDAVGGQGQATQAKTPMGWLRTIAVILLVACIPAAEAAPLVPPGDLPGRERYRFTPSPLDRFMQPNAPARPLLQWDCSPRRARQGKPRSRRTRAC